ncbi:MAG: hypothetical protein AAFY98_00255 [Verrucomicrobiota bacterium]
MRHGTKPSGFSLVEVVVALGLCTFCLTVLLALLPTGIDAKKESVELTQAASLAAEVVADMQAEIDYLRAAQSNPSPPSEGVANVSRFGFARQNASNSPSLLNPASSFFIGPGGQHKTSVDRSIGSASQYRVDVGFDPSTNNNSINATAVRIVISWPAQALGTTGSWPTDLDNSFELMTYLDFSL